LALTDNLNSLKNAFNPAIAVTSDGKIGLLYQQLTIDGWWETHFVMGSIRVDMTFNLIRDWVLSRFQRTEFETINDKRRMLSDYLDLQTVGNTFYGVFAIINTPDRLETIGTPNSRFPTVMPIYQRNQTQLLENTPGINPSIDPFFFKVEPFFSRQIL
jgi:hypothetical protein